MKVKRQDSLELVIEDFPLFPGIVTLPASLFILWKIMERLREQLVFDSDLFGAIIAFLGFFFAAALFNERSVFAFKIYEKRLQWSRVGLLGRRGGIIPFDNIRNVVTQTGPGSCPMTYRLAVVTDGKTVPVTRFYQGGAKESCEHIGKMILDAIGKDASRFIEDSILEMAAAGNRIQAVKLAREHYKMKLREAKEFVEGLTK